MCHTARPPAIASNRNGAGAVCASARTPAPIAIQIHMIGVGRPFQGRLGEAESLALRSLTRWHTWHQLRQGPFQRIHADAVSSVMSHADDDEIMRRDDDRALPAGAVGEVCRLRDRPRAVAVHPEQPADRKSTRLNSSHLVISYAVFCLK